MFEQVFEKVKIKMVGAEKRGCCLEAQNALGERILMDFCGMNPALVPDGTNAYMFGNSVIFVTRWSDMTDREKQTVEKGELCLAIHPCQFVQFSLGVDGDWSDVFTTLHHCYEQLNVESQPVTEAIFIFADTHDSDYVISRRVTLPPYVQKFLQKCNAADHKAYSLDGVTDVIRSKTDEDPYKDYWDLLYDLNWEKTKESSRIAKKSDPKDIPNGVYVEISSDNQVTNMYINEGKPTEEPKEEPMSEEVKMYLKIAQRGIDEGQYNLGVCYETGDGVQQNYEKALFWYKKAADQGHAKAQYNLGVMVYNGYGTKADPQQAAQLFLLSANQGDMYAQFNMGVCYYKGEGVEQNILRALEWFKKAADQGHPQAKKLLSGL